MMASRGLRGYSGAKPPSFSMSWVLSSPAFRAMHRHTTRSREGEEPWQGEVNLATPSFTYDLDQDGKAESYLFGIYHANLPEHVCFTSGVAITFSSEDLGDWLYHIQATLDGTQLTAQAVSTVDTFENYPKENFSSKSTKRT